MTLPTRHAMSADLPAVAAVHIESCLDIYRPHVPAAVHATTLPANLKAVWEAEVWLNGGSNMLA